MRNLKIYLFGLSLIALMSACQPASVQVTPTTVPTQSPSETSTLIPLIRPSSLTAAAQFPGERLNEACQGRPVHEAGIYSTKLDIHPVYFVGDGGLIRRLEKGLPRNWKAVLITNTQLVACVSVKHEVVEVCRYGFAASGFTQVTITRYRATLTVRLLEAKTGRFLDEESFHKIAIDCPSSTTRTSDSDYFPADFESSDIENWLRSFVSP